MRLTRFKVMAPSLVTRERTPQAFDPRIDGGETALSTVPDRVQARRRRHRP